MIEEDPLLTRKGGIGPVKAAAVHSIPPPLWHDDRYIGIEVLLQEDIHLAQIEADVFRLSQSLYFLWWQRDKDLLLVHLLAAIRARGVHIRRRLRSNPCSYAGEVKGV